MPSRQKLGTILLNKLPWEWFVSKTLLMKIGLLIKYSDKKIIFRKIQLNFGLQNWLWKLKMSTFWQSSIKRPYKISKNPSRVLIQMEKSIEFQLHQWEIPQLSPHTNDPFQNGGLECTCFWTMCVSSVPHCL